ncbi:hypothetical protein HPB50_011658 [Hyalomma asiaticum]|uniref:Uncharacterized protein n=1 Tax=Hyalomma asiaticum TaxID=266040 RepID=A0ACB7SPH9_HYAAI|nr:hypothetical protein HPB50_011658 [Hyalomma asiaticum]
MRRLRNLADNNNAGLGTSPIAPAISSAPPVTRSRPRGLSKAHVPCHKSEQATWTPPVLTRNNQREEVKEHERSLEEGSNRDFIDGYIKKMRENKSNPNSNFKMGNLLGNVLNFFGAGSNTVQISIQWHLLNCADKLDSVQRNIQNEIDSVVGRERQPCWEDHNRMHFTMATIWEMYRWRTVAPLSIPRE